MIEERLEAYFSGGNFSAAQQRKISHDVKEFVSLFGNSHEAGEFEAYRQKLTEEGKSEGTIRDSLSRVKKFFAATSNTEGTAHSFDAPHEVITHAVDEGAYRISQQRDDAPSSRRFSLLVSPSMYEALDWLSQYDKCSVAKVIMQACTEYTARRAGDIEFIREQMTLLNRGIEQRRSYSNG